MAIILLSTSKPPPRGSPSSFNQWRRGMIMLSTYCTTTIILIMISVLHRGQAAVVVHAVHDAGIPLVIPPHSISNSIQLVPNPLQQLHQEHHHHRSLAIGDFVEFNTLFENAETKIPDQELSQNTLKLNIKNLICYNINLGDIQFNWNNTNNQQVIATIDINPFDLDCSGDYSYSALSFITGNGGLTASVKNSQATLVIGINTPTTWDLNPPNTSSIISCTTQFNIENIDFRGGGILGNILDLLNNLVAQIIEGQISSLICKKLDTLTGRLDQLFQKLQNRMNTYIVLPIVDNVSSTNGSTMSTNPLSVEQSMILPNNRNNVQLLNFNDTNNNNNNNNTIATFIQEGMNEIQKILGEQMNDPNRKNITDLGVNVLLRKYIVDSDGSFTFQMEDIPNEIPILGGEDNDLFSSNGRLTSTNISLNGLQIYGLDSLQTFNPFIPIGDYTLQSKFQWDLLYVVANVSITMMPSTRNDSIIVTKPDTAPKVITENITISIGFTNVQLLLSTLIALDLDLLGELQLGSLFYTKNLFRCFMSTLQQVNITGLNVTIGNISSPSLSGFVSPGIDRIVQQLVQAGLVMYQPTILKALPGIFQTRFRKLINNKVISKIIRNQTCPTDREPIEPYIDFRDLFLEPNISKTLGGSGVSPYGILVRRGYTLLQNRLLKPNGKGRLGINDMIINRFTTRQSGQRGVIEYKKNLFSLVRKNITNRIVGTIANQFAIRLSNLRLSNLDMLTTPMALLEPTSSATILRNVFTLGNSTDRYVQMGMKLFIDMSGQQSPFNMKNEIDFEFSLGTMGISAEVEALMNSSAVFHFPLKDVVNISCWLATLDTGTSTDYGLLVQAFSSLLMNLSLNATCISCTSNQGTETLQTMMKILKDNGSMNFLTTQLPVLLDSIVTSDEVRNGINSWIQDSAKSCASSPYYIENYATTNQNSILQRFRLPTIPVKSVDTILFAGILGVWTGFMVFANGFQSLPQNNISSTMLTQASNATLLNTSSRILDWTNLGNSTGLGSIADKAFKEIRKFVSRPGDKGSPGIVSLLANTLTGGRTLEIDLRKLAFRKDNFSLSLNTLEIDGLNSFTQFDVLSPIGPQLLQNIVKMDSLSVTLNLTAGYANTPQDLTVRVAIQNITANLTLLAAVDLDKLGNLPLGSILQIQRLLPCAISSFRQLEVPHIQLSVGSFGTPTIEGLMPETSILVSQTLNATTELYGQQIRDMLPALFEGVLQNYISNAVNSYFSNATCSFASTADDQYLDMRDLLLSPANAVKYGASGKSPYGNIIPRLVDLLRSKVLQTENNVDFSKLNSLLINPLTKARSGIAGYLNFSGSLFDKSKRVRIGGLNAQVRLQILDAYLDHLDTIGPPLSLLEAVVGEPRLVNNTATIGINRPFVIGSKVGVELLGGDSDIRNLVDISIGLNDANAIADIFATITTNSFMNFPIKDLANQNCLLALFPKQQLDPRGVGIPGSQSSLYLKQFALSVAMATLNVTCLNCTGPLMPELNSLLSSPDSAQQVTATARKLLSLVEKLLEGDFFQTRIDSMVNEGRKKCPHSPEYDPKFTKSTYQPFARPKNKSDSTEALLVLFYVILCLIATAAFVVLAVKFVVTRRHRKWLQSLTDDNVFALSEIQKLQDSKDNEINAMTKSLVLSPEIPFAVRWFIPVFILGNIGLFLSGHLSLGGSVVIQVNLAGQSYVADNFYEFSVVKSILEIWNAGGQALAIIILLLSGVWPYARQLVLLALWFTPPDRVSVSTRGKTFYWLEALGKWSILDIFVLVLTLVAFRVSVKSPNVKLLPSGFYSIDLLVIPKWGLYANILAQLVSHFASHWMIHYHRVVVGRASEQYTAQQIPNDPRDDFEFETAPIIPALDSDSRSDEASDALRLHQFTRPHRGEQDKLVVRPIVSPLLGILVMVTIALFVIGCIKPGYSIDIQGILGVLVSSGQNFRRPYTEYDVFNTAKVLFHQADFTGAVKDYFGLGSLSILLIVSILVVPILQSMLVAYMWVRSMTKRQRNRWAVIMEILNAWQYAEVWILSVALGSWQLGPTSEWMLNAYCRSLNETFAQLAYYGILQEQDAQCFRVDFKISNGLYVMLAGSCLLALTSSFLTKAIQQYEREADQLSSASLNNDKNVSFTDDDARLEVIERIRPVPVLFTDRFRWLLVREDRFKVSEIDERMGGTFVSPTSDDEEAIKNDSTW